MKMKLLSNFHIRLNKRRVSDKHCNVLNRLIYRNIAYYVSNHELHYISIFQSKWCIRKGNLFSVFWNPFFPRPTFIDLKTNLSDKKWNDKKWPYLRFSIEIIGTVFWSDWINWLKLIYSCKFSRNLYYNAVIKGINNRWWIVTRWKHFHYILLNWDLEKSFVYLHFFLLCVYTLLNNKSILISQCITFYWKGSLLSLKSVFEAKMSYFFP